MTNIHIRFRHLQCFLAIAQHRTVGAAASALAITQPALSKTLGELEDDLDARLFERTRKGMLLTRAGEIFLEHAAASVASLRSGIESIKNSGVGVTVGILPTVAERLMPRATMMFKQRLPEIPVRIVALEHAPLLNMLRLGELDFVVGRLANPESMIGLTFEQLYVEPLVIAVYSNHALTNMKRFRVPLILDYPCVVPHHNTIIGQEVERFLQSHGIAKLRNYVEATTSVAFARRYVAEANAVWFVARGIVETDLSQKVMSALPVNTEAMTGPVGITSRTGRPVQRQALELIAAIRETVAAMNHRAI
ncbi:pca operon transcription factor PcaQ [Pseudorhodoplanes sinuspersici]|uniref:Pca operon transcription factor PcaQ n=1 Tax=Pseudorhodoplanes sinuspersici TaxID=1235591 RepID=A0A1W6ZMI0_9HYPH|nr:pca operon transcription factor PcaQ [Pseudorhodoplanes sinuspersici]ARP98559.1 pca operon transcription factor PcaQ [Pseudorhodoplanes sinuspersici]RKE69868.1 LysR family pca operon transcriptional activator [Pseudorhodoplanes sinuspersici]